MERFFSPGFVDFNTLSNISSTWRLQDKDWIVILWWTYPLSNAMCCFSTQKLAVTFLIVICLFVSYFLSQVIPILPRTQLNWQGAERVQPWSAAIICHMDRADLPARPFEVDVDLGFALFFLFLLCFFLLVTVVRCAQTVVDPYGSISTSTYQEEQITWERGGGGNKLIELGKKLHSCL